MWWGRGQGLISANTSKVESGHDKDNGVREGNRGCRGEEMEIIGVSWGW